MFERLQILCLEELQLFNIFKSNLELMYHRFAKNLIPIIILFFGLNASRTYSQNLFPEKYDDCSTDMFALESDTMKVKVSDVLIFNTIMNAVGQKHLSKIKGMISIQVIVNLDGTSCLISVKNESNIKSKKMNFKEIIDSQLVWEIPDEKVAAIVEIWFDGKTISMRRMGYNSKGYHQIN